MTNNAGSVIFSNEGIFIVNNESNNVWALEGSVLSCESELRNILGKLDLDSYWHVWSVFGSKFWDSSTELISGNVNSEKAQIWGKIDLFLGLESSEEEWVDGVVGQEELEVFSSIISLWDGNWGIGNSNWYFRVEEGSINSSSNVSFWGDNWGTHESIVERKRSLSESLLSSPLGKILINIGVNNGGELGLKLLNNLVRDKVLDEGFDKIGNLGNTWTFKINSDIVLVDNKFNISALNSGSQFSVGSLLGGKINSEISNNVSDIDFSSSCSLDK